MMTALVLQLIAFTMSLMPPAGPPASQPARRDSRTAPSKAREREFQRALSNTTLEGVWQMTGPDGLAGKAPLSEPRPDKYTIDRVSKASGDYWVISARIQYADKDVTIPVTVRVVWAGDTPVITVDDMAFPGLGTYSARVLIHKGFYSGTWFGKNYGGVLSGRIVKQEAAKKPTSKPSRE